MAYRLIIPKPVQKDVDSLPAPIRMRVNERLSALADDPRPYGYIKLKGHTNQYRIRIGDYRIVYEIYDQELVILIIYVLNRKDA